MGGFGVGSGDKPQAIRPVARPPAEAVRPPAGPAGSPVRPSSISTFEAAPARSPVELHAPAGPAATAAAQKVTEASAVYETARSEVSRLNGHLERALLTEPSLRDPAAAARFRTEFEATHASVYGAEKAAAQALADALRTAQPLIRADGATISNLGNRLDVVEGLTTLAGSSEYRQAAELAGQYGQGHDPTFPAEDMADVAERAALTGLREDLSAGASAEDSIRTASGLLGAAGFGARVPALSAIGNAIGAGADLSDFMRTGDPASLGAAGFGALGTAAAATAVFATGPIAIGAGVVGGVALGGKFITRQIAGDNAYDAAVQGPLAQSASLSVEQAELLQGRDARILADAGLSHGDLVELARSGDLTRAAEIAWGGQFNTGDYADSFTPEAFEARVRELEQSTPGRHRVFYESTATDELRAERHAAGSAPELLRADLVAMGLLD